MEKIRALIVDDEKPARQRLLDLLSKQPEVTIVGECASSIDAVPLIRKTEVDLLFLDIQMPVLSGFEVVKQVGLENLPVTIFVTAFDSYAVRAFEARALDYLLKPYSDERFGHCLTRALDYVRTHRREELSGRVLALLEEREHLPESLSPYPERLLIKVGGRVVFLPTSEISWIAAAGVSVQLHTTSGSYLHRASLSELESQLDPERFVRIHRSTIVNTDRVKELYLHTHGDYVTVLKDGTELKLSRHYRAKFEVHFRQSL